MSGKHDNFGKYLLLEKLATGGMAEIYLARSTGAIGITKFVAIKRILPQFNDSPEFIEMFKDEAKIAINLSHSNIVSIYEFGVEKGQFYLAMDYVEGRNLRQILNKMKKAKVNLSIDQIVYIAKEVAAGLDHAHRCLDGSTGRPLNITHRDMSPQNVMISYEGEVRIVDFGIAKAESQLETTKAGTLKGKFGYMSPEQAEGLAVDLRTDIFSLGIVLWELLANDRLFIANNEINTLRKIRDCNVPSLRKINASVPPELEKIVSKALAKDRNLRYQTAAAFQKDLNRFLNRQYPDFSAQDFSVFCKTLFADEILEHRKRLIGYAKLPVTSKKDVDEKTEITSTLTDHDFNPPKEDQGLREFEMDKSVKNQRINIESSEGQKTKASQIDFKLRDPMGESPTAISEALKESSKIKAIQSRMKRRKLPLLLGNSFLWMMVVVFVGAGAAFYWQKPLIVETYSSRIRPALEPLKNLSPPKSVFKPNPAPTAAPAPVPQAPPVNVPSGEKYTVLVTSSPATAEIYLNGESTKVLTPGTIQVDANRTFSLAIKADGYLHFERSYMASQNPMRIQASLQQAKLGYLDINVMPAGSTVYINNEPLTEKPPIRRRPVTAGVEVWVRATNPFTGASDETRITVEQDKVKKVNLFPKTRGNGSK